MRGHSIAFDGTNATGFNVTLGNQAALGFRTDYYVTGEYPGGAGVSYFELDSQGRPVSKPNRRLPPDAAPAPRTTLADTTQAQQT